MIKHGIVATLLFAVSLVPAHAEILSSKNRKSVFQAQTRVLDTRAKEQYSNSVTLLPTTLKVPSKFGVTKFKGKYSGPFLNMARTAARRNGVPEDLFLRLVNQESGWNHRARSHKGAIGLAQLMPQTARKLGVNPNDPKQNLEGGARYLREQYETFGSWRLALAAYNAGPGAVQKYNGVPPYKETQSYVRIIWGS